MLGKSSIVFFLLVGSAGAALAEDAQYDPESRQVVQYFVKQLGGTLKKELDANGPEAAIGVCRDLAPKIANQVSLEKGWKVTRVGTRVRNPMIGTPDAWEQGVLAEFQKRQQGGEKLETMEFSQIVEEPAGKFYRYLKPIGVQTLCLGCHGSPADIKADVKATLARHYPHDKATGYSDGQLRGAVSIKRPL